MKLEGARIAFLGDSITEGVGTSEQSNRYADLLAKNYGVIPFNYGISGTRFAEQIVKENETCDFDAFTSRFDKMEKDVDCVVVFGSTNDYGHGDAPIGIPSDRTSFTFYGACHTLMQGLLEIYVGKPVVFLTPLHRTNDEKPSDDVRKNGKGLEPLVTHRNIIKEIAEIYALPVLDLYAMSGIQPNNAIVAEALCPDGLHPNDAGHVILSERIAHFLLGL